MDTPNDKKPSDSSGAGQAGDDRHVNWFALEKACDKPGCPVCTIVAERSARYIDNMLFEHVSDRGFRARYRASGGFCAVHAKSLESFRDGLAVAILGEDILASILPDVRRRRIPKSKALCPACEATRGIEREFLGYLAERTERDFISFFTASEGLCVPHYRAMTVLCRRTPKWLSVFHEEKFEALLERTRRFVECSAWGRQADFALLSDRDKIVWKEIARNLRGSAD